MKQNVRTVGVFLLAGILAFSCAGNPDTGKAKKTEKEEKTLTLDQKARNTFKNTTVIFSGSMVLAFSETFRTQADAFAGAFDTELNKEDLDRLDDQIAGLGDDVMSPLEEMMNQMDEAFDDLSEENLTIYEKMFLHDIMKEGVAITEKYELPAGFRPMSQNLTRDEIKRYIIKLSTDGEDMDDPIMKTYMELFEWFQKVSTTFEQDPEIQTFLRGIRT